MALCLFVFFIPPLNRCSSRYVSELSVRLSVCACVPEGCDRKYLINRFDDFHQIYKFGAFRDKDKLVGSKRAETMCDEGDRKQVVGWWDRLR